jgi:hypothetical protein
LKAKKATNNPLASLLPPPKKHTCTPRSFGRRPPTLIIAVTGAGHDNRPPHQTHRHTPAHRHTGTQTCIGAEAHNLLSILPQPQPPSPLLPSLPSSP